METNYFEEFSMKTLIPKSVCWLLVVWLLSIPLNSKTISLQAKAEWTNVGKIVAIGDIHGAYDEFVAILQELGLIDQKLHWIGGKTHLVQIGDYIDRGVHDRKVLDLLMQLEKQAEKAGGRLHPLMGNHEAMNMIGDLRYVTRESYATYATDKTEELREKTYARYVKYREARAKRNIPPQEFQADQKFKEEWMTKHPPGYFEQRKAFSDSGAYGRWLLNRNAVLKLNDTIFLHGGINETISQSSLREINERVRKELRSFFEMRKVLVSNGILDDSLDYDEALTQVSLEIDYQKAKGVSLEPPVIEALQQFQTLGNWFITHPTGPLWYRGYAQEPEETFKPLLDRIKTNLGAAHLVVGHTPMLTGITGRFAEDIFLIDTGILRRYYKGLCSALIIENGKFTPVYPKSGPCA